MSIVLKIERRGACRSSVIKRTVERESITTLESIRSIAGPGQLFYKDSEGDYINLDEEQDVLEMLQGVPEEQLAPLHILRRKEFQWTPKKKLLAKMALVFVAAIFFTPCFLHPLLVVLALIGAARHFGFQRRCAGSFSCQKAQEANEPVAEATEDSEEKSVHPYASQIAQLKSLGFTDTLRNLVLLSDHAGDLNLVINELLAH